MASSTQFKAAVLTALDPDLHEMVMNGRASLEEAMQLQTLRFLGRLAEKKR